jgi:glucose-6-phosphate isomerase
MTDVTTPGPEASPTPAAPLTVDFTLALDTALGAGQGLADADLAALTARLPDVVASARRQREAGGLAFLGLPDRRDLVQAIVRWNDHRPPAEDLVVAGIGGSALGARALAGLGSSKVRLHVVDTVDPQTVERLTGTLDPASTLLIGVSKSGTTMEAAAVFAVVEAWMRDALGPEAKRRIAVVCGEETNPLRTLANARGYPTLPVPVGVGGRYSVLSPVGLLPAAILGVPVEAVMDGARHAARAALEGSLLANPALVLAALLRLAWDAGRRTVVHFAYREAFAELGPWWVQLVAESLGKDRDGEGVGPTPLAALGPADQHSMLQLLLEGPDDKLVVFLDTPSVDGTGPVIPAEADALAPIGAVHLGTLLAAEREATAFALARAGRPSLGVHLADTGPAAVGAYLVTWEAAVAHAGALFGVDPFDQPAVALGKRAAKARLRGEPRLLADEMAKLRSLRRRVSG